MSQEICNGDMNQCSAYTRQNYYIRQVHSDGGEPRQVLPLCLSGRGLLHCLTLSLLCSDSCWLCKGTSGYTATPKPSLTLCHTGSQLIDYL